MRISGAASFHQCEINPHISSGKPRYFNIDLRTGTIDNVHARSFRLFPDGMCNLVTEAAYGLSE